MNDTGEALIPGNEDHLQQLHGHPNSNDHQKYSKYHFYSGSEHIDDSEPHLQGLSSQLHGNSSQEPLVPRYSHI